MLRSDCTRNCWLAAGLIGLAIMLVTGFGGFGLMAALFLGFVGFWLSAGFLIWALCAGVQDDVVVEPARPAPRRPASQPAIDAGPAPERGVVSILAPRQPLGAQTTGAVRARPGAPQAPTFGWSSMPHVDGKGAMPAEPAPEAVPVVPQPVPAAPVAAMPAETVVTETLADPVPQRPDPAAPVTGPADRPGRGKDGKAKDGKDKPGKDKSDKEDKAARRARKAEKARKRAEAEAVAAALLNTRAHETRDDLGRINGIGPQLTQWLNAQGIWRYEQIAAWTDAERDDWAARLGSTGSRIAAQDWVGQARALIAAGPRAGAGKDDQGGTA